jgi:hypothetical protein
MPDLSQVKTFPDNDSAASSVRATYPDGFIPFNSFRPTDSCTTRSMPRVARTGRAHHDDEQQFARWHESLPTRHRHVGQSPRRGVAMHALPRLVWRWLHQVWVDDDDNLTFLYSFVDSNQVTCPCYTHHHCCPADGRNGIPAIPADVHAQCGCLFARANEVHESFRCSFLLASSCVSAATAGARVAVRAHASASLRFVLQRGTQPGGRQWCLFRVWQACAHEQPSATVDVRYLSKRKKIKMVHECKHRNQNDVSNGRVHR